jgi:hypothetical protein
MVAEQLPTNASLSELLSARARRTPADRLLIDIVGGALVAAVSLWARPAGWVALLAVATCFLSYGAWAIAERRLLPPAWPARIEHESAWRALHTTSAFIGLAAFGLLLFACLGIALGTIVS